MAPPDSLFGGRQAIVSIPLDALRVARDFIADVHTDHPSEEGARVLAQIGDALRYIEENDGARRLDAFIAELKATRRAEGEDPDALIPSPSDEALAMIFGEDEEPTQWTSS